MIDTGKESFLKNKKWNNHLGLEVFRSLIGNKDRELLIDLSMDRKVIKSHMLIALSLIFSKEISKKTDKKRVGILFPPGIGGFIANIGVLFSGHIPVNLNFTLGSSAFQACSKNADIDLVITAAPVLFKLKDKRLKLPKNKIDLAKFLKGTSKFQIIKTWILLKLLPLAVSEKFFKVPSLGGENEAGILFTSGSSGDPKGVVLSHKNILGNCEQIDAFGILPEGETLLANLPIFHSFGFTVSLWYGLLRRMRSVTYPSPTDTRKCAEIIEREKVTVMLGTPTFFKPYVRKVEKSKLESLKYVIAGAEKTPPLLANDWENKFDCEYLEGYGLTETTPVISVNMPKCVKTLNGSGKRENSVGRMVQGVQAKILDPDTLEPIDPESQGILMLSGVNIFESYLNEPQKTAEVKKDSWFTTGDIARFDKDGFLYIEGRLSRFSKIGGEMVPHSTIENALIKAFEIDESEGRQLVVTGKTDEVKGEALVILTTQQIDGQGVINKLKELGFANLWIPKIIKVVDHIPCLATGKLDLCELSSVAASA